MGCVLDMTVPPNILLNQLHSYGDRLTTSSVADTDATDPHFLVDSGASVHLISQSLVDEGYLRICQEWTVNERCTTASGQEMILDQSSARMLSEVGMLAFKGMRWSRCVVAGCCFVCCCFVESRRAAARSTC